MTRVALIITISLSYIASLANAQYVVPTTPYTDLFGPASEYESDLSSIANGYTHLQDCISDPGKDDDNDGITDLVEFLVCNNKTDADPEYITKLNLALSLALDWDTNSDGVGGVDLQDRLQELFDNTTMTLPVELEGLSPTLETQFHEELMELACDLNYDPTQIDEWVYNNIKYENYALSRKGALSTFRTRRGNEWDQCSLLITLLRLSGFPSRYAVGQTHESLEGNSATTKDVVFVQAWLPVSSYAMASDNNLDSDNRAWVTLAPWYKDIRVPETTDLFPVINPEELDIRYKLLTSQWRFDGDTNDSEDSNHASVVNGPLTYSSADAPVTGQFAILDGGTRIQLPDHKNINQNPFRSRSITLWFKDHTAASNKQEMLFAMGDNNVGLNIYLLNGKVYAGTWNTYEANGGNSGHWVESSNYTHGEWNHVTVVLDAKDTYDPSNQDLRLYINGEFVGSASASRYSIPGHIASIGGSSDVVRVSDGSGGWTNSNNTSELYFKGGIDDVRLFAGCLRPEQLASIMAGNKVDRADYLSPFYNSSNEDAYDANTQKSSVEYQVDRVVDYLSEFNQHLSLNDVLYQEEITSLGSGKMPATLPSELAIKLSGTPDADYFIDDVADTNTSAVFDEERRASLDVRLVRAKNVLLPEEVYDTDPSDSVDTLNLAASWHFDEDAGNTISGNINYSTYGEWQGQLQGFDDGHWLPTGGIYGGALQFNGIDERVSLAVSTGALEHGHYGFEERTVSMWIRVSLADITGEHVLFDEGGPYTGAIANNGNCNGITLRLINDSGVKKIQAAVMGSSDTSSTATVTTATVTANYTYDSVWRHVTVVYDGPSGKLRLYVQGQATAVANHSISEVFRHGNGGGLGCRIGSDAFDPYDDGSVGAANFYKGEMDEVRVYNKALTFNQINDLRKPELASNILAYKKLVLPQINGRRVVFQFTDDLATRSDSTALNVQNADILLDGHTLNPTGEGSILPEDAGLYSAFSAEHRPYSDITWTRQPDIGPGALVSLGIDALGCSQARVHELSEQLGEANPLDALSSDAVTREAYLGLYGNLLTETFIARSYENDERVSELMHVKPVHYTQTNPLGSYRFVQIWTHPDDNNRISTDSINERSTFGITPGWNIDAVKQFALYYKANNPNSLFSLNSNSGQYIALVSGHADSLNEADIFEDWQGTPGLSTIAGLHLAAKDPSVDVKIYEPGTTADINAELSGLDAATRAQIIAEVASGSTVITPSGEVAYKDGEVTLINSTARIVISNDSIAWLFDGYNGGITSNIVDYGEQSLSTNWNTIDFGSVDVSIDDSIVGNSVTGGLIQNYDINKTGALLTDVGDPVNTVTGEFYLEEKPDIHIYSRGPDLNITRRYGSQIIYDGPFGYGWGWSHAESILVLTKEGTKTVQYYDATRKLYEFTEDDPENHQDELTAPPGITFEIVIVREYGSIVGYEVKFRNGNVIRLSANGLLKYKSDPYGNTLTFEYDSRPVYSSRIVAIRDSIDRELTLDYNNNGKVTKVTDFTGRSITYGYDGSDLIWFKDLEGNVYRYEYLNNQAFTLNNHNLSKQILPNGDYLSIYYNKNDTTSHHTNSKGDTFYFRYSWVNRYTETWNESGYYRKVFYSNNWDVIRVMTEDGNIERKQYDQEHNMIVKYDGNGNRTIYKYDDNRNMLSATNPEGETQAYGYDELRGVVTDIYTQIGDIEEDDTPGNYFINVLKTHNSYDAETGTLLTNSEIGTEIKKLSVTENGVPIVTSNTLTLNPSTLSPAPSEKHTTSYQYDDHGNLVKITESVGTPDGLGAIVDEVTHHIYDINGLNLVRKKDPRGNYTNYVYDDLGRVIAVTDPDGKTTQVELNGYGQPVRSTNAVGNVTINEYDVNRRLVKTTNPKGAESSIKYGTPFYGRNFERVIEEVDPLGYIISHEYDTVGDRIATTDANGNTTHFKYDAMSRLVESIDALGNVARNRYDGAGNLIEVTAVVGDSERVVQFRYDRANRIVRRREMWDDQRAIEYVYDLRGNLEQEKHGYYGQNNTSIDPTLLDPIIIEHEYDKRNRRTKTTRYYNDETGHVGDRITEFTYDTIGRLRVRIEKGATEVDPDTGVPTQSGNLRKSIFTYDEAGNLTDEIVLAPEGAAWKTIPASHIRHEYDNRNLRIKTVLKDTQNGSYDDSSSDFRITSFTYDAAGRLKTSTVTAGPAATHLTPVEYKTVNEYDAVGNIVLTTTYADDFEIKNEFTYNERNELVTKTNALGYTKTFTYDGNGNQVSSTDEEGNTSYVYYDALNRQVAVKDALGYTSKLEYDDLGNLIATTTPLGERTKSVYNKNNELIEKHSPLSTIDSEVNPVTFDYDEFGRLLSTTDARGNTINETTYNKFSEPYRVQQTVKLLQTSTAVEPEVITGYDGLGRVLSVKDPEGTITRTTYDVLGRVKSVTQAVGTDGLYGDEETVTTYQYYPTGNVKQEVRAQNESEDSTTTEYEYDELNRLVKTKIIESPTSSLDTTVTYTYDGQEQTVTTEGPFGVQTATVFDKAGRRIETWADTDEATTGLELASTWEYDRRGLVTRTDTPEDAPTVFIYDARGQLIRQIEAPGSTVEAVTSFEYDANGRQIRVTDANKITTQTNYDVNNRVIRTIEALGSTTDEAITKYNYDANDNLISVIDAKHISATGKYLVDIADDEFDQEAVRYVYDELNRIVQTYEFGDKDDVDLGVKAPGNGRLAETVVYDLNGNPVETTLRDGTVIKRTYDRLNRLRQVDDITNLTENLQTFEYDKQSRMIYASDTNYDLAANSPATHTVEYTYDFAGRLIRENGYEGDANSQTPPAYSHAIKHTYSDGATGFSLATTTEYIPNYESFPNAPLRTFIYSHNMRGLPGKAEEFQTGNTTIHAKYKYDNNGRITEQITGTVSTQGHTLKLSYDARGREVQRRYLQNYYYNSGTEIDSFSQTTSYDAVSNIKSELTTDYIGTINPIAFYDYDDLYRLERKRANEYVDPGDTTWSHDAVGNWLASNQNGVPETFSPNHDNEYENVGPSGSPKEHKYDDLGNLIYIGDDQNPADGHVRYTYDWASRLIKVEERASNNWTTLGAYEYDALNRRVTKKAGSTITVYAYDGSQVAFESQGSTLASASPTQSYAYHAYIDSPILVISEHAGHNLGSAGSYVYYLQDRRFNVVALAKPSDNTIIERYRYEAFGRMTVYDIVNSTQPSQSAYANPYGFTGRRYDPETTTTTTGQGLWHYRNRMYSARLGRFLQRDPAGYVDGFNLYAYVRNNPFRYADALGLTLLNLNTSSVLNNWGQSSSLDSLSQMSNTVPSLMQSTYASRKWTLNDELAYHASVLEYSIKKRFRSDVENAVLTTNNLINYSWGSNVDHVSQGVADTRGLIVELPQNLSDIHTELYEAPIESIPLLFDTYVDLGISEWATVGNAAENTGRGLFKLAAMGFNYGTPQGLLLSSLDYEVPTVEYRYWAGNYGITDRYYPAAFATDLTQFGGETLAGEGLGALFVRGGSMVDDGLRLTDDMMSYDNAVVGLDGQLTKVDNLFDTPKSGVQANQAAGNVVRDRIAAETGGAIEQNFRVTGGLRRVDVVVDTLGIESKVGRTSLTQRVRQELARDIKILRSGQLDAIQWIFTRSQVTGKTGPTGSLRALLEKYGIEIVE